MNLREYLQELNWWIGICAGGAFIFCYLAMIDNIGLGSRMSFGFLGFGAGVVCLIFISQRFASRSKGKITLSKQFKFSVPTHTSVILDPIEKRESDITVFFGDTSPDMLRGDITILIDDDLTSGTSIKLTQAEPLCNPFLPRGTKQWAKSTGRRCYPLSIPFKNNSNTERITIVFNLNWNFEGTYLDRFIPKDRMLTVDITVLTKASKQQLY
jgi:hypothetical protein